MSAFNRSPTLCSFKCLAEDTDIRGKEILRNEDRENNLGNKNSLSAERSRIDSQIACAKVFNRRQS